jgi:hypothetical protein
LESQDVLAGESRVRVEQVQKRARQQSGSDNQYQSQSHLKDHERIARPEPGGTASAAPQLQDL